MPQERSHLRCELKPPWAGLLRPSQRSPAGPLPARAAGDQDAKQPRSTTRTVDGQRGPRRVVPPPPEGFATWDRYKRSQPPEEQDAWFACVDPSGVGPRLFFQRVPEGKAVKNRVHLDVRVGTGLVGEERLAALEAECARLVPLGAVHVQTLYDGNDACIPMLDIEGNEFCID